MVVPAGELAAVVEGDGDEEGVWGRQVFCARLGGEMIGEKIGKRPPGVVLHLVDERFERIVEDAEADDVVDGGETGALAPGAGGVFGGEGRGAFGAGGLRDEVG